MPRLGLPPTAGLEDRDVLIRDPGRECVGGAGRGAEGGGAGGPRPTTGIPRSSSGSADRPFCILARELARLEGAGGSGDCDRDVDGRSGIARS